MKRLVLCCLVTLVTTHFASAQDFRKITWGMTADEVKTTESGEPHDVSEGIFSYPTTVADKKAFVIYYEYEGRVLQGAYMFTESYSNRNQYIVDYQEFKEILTSKYGNPKKDKTIWDIDLFRDDLDQWGFAVSLGHLAMQAEWESKTTLIRLTLKGNNYDITHAVVYVSLEHQDYLENYIAKKKAADF